MLSRIVYRNLMSMGTRLDMVFTDISEEQADAVFHEVQNSLEKWEQKLSIYRDDSFFSRLNKKAYEEFIDLDDEISGLFSKLIEYHQLTNGYFDFTLGNISSHRFSDKEVDEFLSTDLTERIAFDPDKKQLKILHPLVLIDSGSFGKGLALDDIKKILLKHKIQNCFITFGGSSVAGLGRHTAADFWPVGISDFTDQSKNMYVFELKDSSLSISGNSLNNLKKFPEGHILNPKTGKRHKELELICVEGSSSFVDEILSTAIFACPEEMIKSICGNFPAYKIVKITYDRENKKSNITEY